MVEEDIRRQTLRDVLEAVAAAEGEVLNNTPHPSEKVAVKVTANKVRERIRALEGA